MRKYINHIVLGIIFAIVFTSCSSVSRQTVASRHVSEAWLSASEQYFDSSFKLKTRYNPSPCDQNLKYEVELFGHFRHVQIIGEQTILENMEAQAKDYKKNSIFQHEYNLNRELYTSSCGQDYYVLSVLP